MTNEILQEALETLLNEGGTISVGLLKYELKPFGKAVVEPLSVALFETKYSPEVRENIVAFLANLEDRRAVAPLIQLAESLPPLPENSLYIATLQALGKLKDPQAVDILLTALQSSYAEVQAVAAEVFWRGDFNDARALDLLIAAVQSENIPVRVWAARALGHFDQDLRHLRLAAFKADFYSSTVSMTRWATLDGLVELGDLGIAVLLENLEIDNIDKQCEALIHLGLARFKDNFVVPAIVGKLKHPNPKVRAKAAGALLTPVENPEMREVQFLALLEIVENLAEDITVLEKAVRGQHFFKDKRAGPVLLTLLQRELTYPPTATADLQTQTRLRSKLLLEVTITALGLVQFNEAYDLLLTLAHEPNMWEIRSTVLLALGYLGDGRAFDYLREVFLSSSSNYEKERALLALGQLKDSRSFEYLLLGLRDADSSMRHRAAYSLGLFGDSRANPSLIEALRDAEPGVRFEAAEALGKLKAAEAWPILKAMAEEDSAEVCFCCHSGTNVAEAAQWAIKQLEET